jgi:hypothetical protein
MNICSPEMDPYILTEVFGYLDLISKCTVKNTCTLWRKGVNLPERLPFISSHSPIWVYAYMYWTGWREFETLNVNQKMSTGCILGDIQLVHKMINHGADQWNDGLHDACLGGHHDLTQLMIEHGADDWNLGLLGACDSGDRDLIRLMIDHGATHCRKCRWSVTSGQPHRSTTSPLDNF